MTERPRAENQENFYEVQSDFPVPTMEIEMEAYDGNLFLDYAVDEEVFNIYLDKGHYEIKRNYGYLDFGGKIWFNKKTGLLRLSLISGAFDDTPREKYHLIAGAIRNYLEKIGLTVSTIGAEF